MNFKFKKISLKKRVRKMISLLNFFNLLIMLFALLLSFAGIIIICGKIVSNCVVQQMQTPMQEIWSNWIEENSANNTDYQNLNKSFLQLGNPYRISPTGNPNTLSLDTSENVLDKFELDQKFLTIQYKVYKSDNTLIFDSMNPNDLSLGPPPPKNFIMKTLNSSVTIGLYNIKNNNSTLGRLEVNLNPFLIYDGFIILFCIGVIIFFITLFTSHFPVHLLSELIIRPLNDLNKKMQEIADENIEGAMNTEIELVKPVIEVENLVNTSNSILSTVHNCILKLEDQKFELKKQNEILQENSRTVEQIN